MSSSVLRNVIQPKAQTSPLEKMREEAKEQRTGPSVSAFGFSNAQESHKHESEDMELVLGVLVENAPVAMAMFDRAMRYMLANRQWINEFGLQQVQPLVGRSQYEIFPGLHPGWRQVYERALQGHIVRSEHDSLSGPDGRHLVYRWEVRPWRRKRDASVGGLMVTCEKFSSPQAASADESKAGSFPENKESTQPAKKTPEPLDCALPMLVLDAQGTILHANVAAAHLTLDKGIQEGTTCFWEVFGEGRDFSALRQQTLESLASVAAAKENVPGCVITQSGSSPDHQKPSRWLVSALARKGSDESPCQFMLMALPPQATSETVTRVTFQMPVQPPTAAPAMASEDAAAIQRMENELLRSRQELRTLAEAQHTFGNREARLRSYLEGVPCGVFVLDERGSPVFQNERLARLLGRPLEKDQTVENWLAHACPTEEHREQVTLAWRESVWRRQLTRTVSLATADGLLKELEFHPIALPGGGMLVSIQDTTEHTRHEEQLRSMEAKLRTLLQGSPIAIVLTDKAGVIFEVNQHAESLLGQAKSELRRYPLDAWLDPDSATARRDALRALQNSGRQAEALGVRIKRVDGTFSRAILHLATVPDAQGETHCTIHYLQQVTEPDAAVSTPVSAGAQTSPTPAEQTHAILLITDANGRVRTWTGQAQELFNLDAALAISRPLHQFFRPSDATGFFADLARQAADPQNIVERPFFDANAKRGEVKISARLLDDGGFELTSHSTSEIKAHVAVTQPSHALKAAVPLAFQVVSPSSQRWPVVDLEREKLLLTETHHRIKNHLQIISSLLNMQINGVSDQDARDALRSSQSRVRAIAALHQHLYQVALGKGDTFSDFTRDLVAHLRECYELTADQISVRLEIQEGPIQQEWLMPLALTLNEALSNCFEHAYPHGRQGQITATLNYAQASGELIISDDGIGLPSDFHPGEGNGLGLKILAVFADQMRGQLFVQGNPDQGTEIKLRFPLASTEG
ncbi:PAS domain-containing protein [Prosthecobacter sp.]|uniref:PAS domain-containing protein n=1 Tax=Prosthecobacter sp. TaxID=1965333 RepID=UPI002ABA1AC8|nr:PAS domain-containing protein [Prosthecobacter sp.]MDZ4402152.1 PAS domain S-box protein [Prosthecobacter sp.]